ncbi:RodZ domain-containing protein [Nitrosovibrio sp. Nv17]|uniref:helix-turn-helix domain-containing protein n=1 Tax=Nitrosovibrio sp. Nv17 TaxID=1855339 RepID=UPI0015A539A2|nr:RodZ domain-containing protein [Nitrosovibrio sp. Nv17]
MSTVDESGSHATETGSNGSGARIGDALRSARLARGMSVGDAARQLRLSVRQITALEQDDYDKLAGGTFLRGFVRNYARLLQMDAKPLLQRLEQSQPAVPVQTISYRTEGIPFPSGQGGGKRGLLIAAAVILVLLLAFEIHEGGGGGAGGLAFMKTEPGDGIGPVEPSQDRSPFAGDAGDAGDAGTGTGGEPANRAAAGEAPEISAPLPAPVPRTPGVGTEPAEIAARALFESPPPEPVTGKDALHLTFDGESWVEVKDDDGRLLLSRINPAGTQQVLRGKPPFFLTIGNAAQVRLVYNSRPVDLAPHTNAYGGTARLSIQ